MKEIGSYFNFDCSAFKNQYISNTNMKFYFSGRNAIKTIVHDLVIDRILLPNYSCESINNSIICEKEYFEITGDFKIDIDNLYTKLKDYKYIYIIDFFGKKDDFMSEISTFCKSHGIMIIQDFTHDIFNNLYGDVCLCSYRKWLPTCFGCMVVDKYNLLSNRISFSCEYLLIR